MDQIIYNVDKGVSEYYDYNSPAVTLEEAKAHLIVTFDEDDVYISALILAATQAIADYCNISINNAMITVWGKADSVGRFKLPFGPVSYVISVASIEPNGESCFATLFGNKTIGTIQNAELTIAYYTGFSKPIQNNLKQAILAQIAYMYENRGDQDKQTGICALAQQLSQPFREIWI
jgi:hypothetical protein